MHLLLLVFLAVSLAVLAAGLIWSEVSRRDQIRGAHRLGEELLKPAPTPETPTERLFPPSLSAFDLDLDRKAPGAAAGPPTEPAPGEGPASPGWPGRGAAPAPAPARKPEPLAETLQQAGLKVTPQAFLAAGGAAALVLGVLGLLLQGWVLAVPALVAGGVAPWLWLRG